MVNWRAVGFGVVVEGILAFTGVLVPVIGHALIGFAGGFVAGTLAGGGPRAGLETGGVTGGVSAVVVTMFGVVIAGTVGFGSPIADVLETSAPIVTTLFDLGVGPALLLGAVTVVVFSVGGGVVGATLRGEKSLPTIPPEDRNRR